MKIEEKTSKSIRGKKEGPWGARALRVRGVTLRELCGHCTAYAFGLASESGLNEHLILGRPVRGDDELGLLNLLLPAHAPRDWIAAWTSALREVVDTHAGAAFVNIHQAEHDLTAALAGGVGVYLTSVALTTPAAPAGGGANRRSLRRAKQRAVEGQRASV